MPVLPPVAPPLPTVLPPPAPPAPEELLLLTEPPTPAPPVPASDPASAPASAPASRAAGQTPAWQVPPEHGVPSVTFDHAVVELAGAHTWQALAGSMVPDGTSAPPRKHPAPQLPAMQTWPAPHAVPSARSARTQLPMRSHAPPWQGFPSPGHAAPLAAFTTVQPPLPSQVELTWQLVAVHGDAVPVQVPAAHTSFQVQGSPSLHSVPPATSDHSVVEVAGAHTRQALAGFTVPTG